MKGYKKPVKAFRKLPDELYYWFLFFMIIILMASCFFITFKVMDTQSDIVIMRNSLECARIEVFYGKSLCSDIYLKLMGQNNIKEKYPSFYDSYIELIKSIRDKE